MNFTYEELRRMFENGKVEAKKSIAAYLIQESSVTNPKTAKQISDALNIPVQSIINMFWDAEYYAKALGYRFSTQHKTFYNDYVSVNDPSDMVRLKSSKNVYWAQKM